MRGTQEFVGSSPIFSIIRNAYTSMCMGISLFIHIVAIITLGTTICC